MTQDTKLIVIFYDNCENSEIEENNVLNTSIHKLVELVHVQAYQLSEVKRAQYRNCRSMSVLVMEIVRKCGFYGRKNRIKIVYFLMTFFHDFFDKDREHESNC